MPENSEKRTQIAWELNRRSRLAVPAFAGGFLYLLSAIVITAALTGLPTVGPLQGLQHALRGEAHPPVSTRTAEVKFVSQHAFALIAGSTMAAIAVLALVLVLLLLYRASEFRREQMWRPARTLVLVGGIAVAVLGIAHQVVGAIEAHRFAVGHDHSHRAMEHALTKATVIEVVGNVGLLAGLLLFIGMVATMLNALRVGLITRWMGYLGMFTGFLIFAPLGGATLQLIPAFWMVMMGILLSGRWMGGDPPAWEAGEARPWPSRAQVQAERTAKAKGEPVPAAVGAGDVAPAPRPQQAGTSRKRRRKGAGPA
jgi:hypothetical protein